MAPIPPTAAMCGFQIKVIPTDKNGLINFELFKELIREYNTEIAGTMITNPNTCGRFEKDIKEISDLIHSVGAYFYCDGANYNAIVGKIRPADLGIDVMHFNLHKNIFNPSWRRWSGIWTNCCIKNYLNSYQLHIYVLKIININYTHPKIVVVRLKAFMVNLECMLEH